MKVTIKNFPFLIADIISFYAALFLTLFIRFGNSFTREIFFFHLKPFTWSLVFLIGGFYVMGLYDLSNLSKLFRYFRLLVTAVLLYFVLATAYFYFSPAEGITPKTILVILTLVFGIIDFSIREILRRYLMKSQPLVNILLIGKGEDVGELAKYLGENPQMGYKIGRWIKDYDIRAIDEALSQNDNKVIVIPHQLRGDKFFADKIYEKLVHGVDIISFSEFYENVMGKVSMDELRENWFVEKIKPKDGLYSLFKRILDTALAFFVLLVTVILWPLIALIIKLSSKGQAFFLKERVGLHEKKFVLYKFRTMHSGQVEKTELSENFSSERGDKDRIFSLGKWMRKMRIDEWPQAINVLKGDLSFVGPRADFFDYYDLLKQKIPYYQIRTIIVPGLSGWAQIHNKTGSSVENARERLAYDIYYIKNRSFVMDLAITLKTLKTIFTLSGA